MQRVLALLISLSLPLLSQQKPNCEALKRYQEHARTIPGMKESEISEPCPTPKKKAPANKKPPSRTPARKDEQKR